MAEWIRRSNKFGVEIFESTTEMAKLSDRSEWADIRDRYLTMLNMKLDAEVEPYLILGACNPPLAHRAVDIDRQIGLLLPCNVVVRTDPDDDTRVLVEAMNPQLLVRVTGEPALQEVADEVTAKLRAAIRALGPTSE